LNTPLVTDRNEAATRNEAAGLSFGKQHRLQTAADFSQVFANRRALRGEIFDLHYRSPGAGGVSGAGGARFGIVVAKKLAHRAVQRNLLKRLARELFRVWRRQLPPYDLVLRLAKPPGECLDGAARIAWRADIQQLLMRLPR